MLLEEGYWISTSFTIIYLKTESYIQLKTYNVLMPVVHLVHMTTEMTKSLQYIYNKGLISYIKTLFKNEKQSVDNNGLWLQLKTYVIL